MPQAQGVTRAKLFVQTPQGKDGQAIDVQFNPASLTFTLQNTMQQQGQNKRQHVSHSSAKLTMDLLFDTTDTGDDVRGRTRPIAELMTRPKPRGQQQQQGWTPPVVAFDWGSFRFKGMLESYRETIDFFAPQGVPLRASVNITLAQQDYVFEPGRSGAPTSAQQPAVVGIASGQDLDDVLTQAGGPGSASERALAEMNKVEDMRRPPEQLAVPTDIQLAPPRAFASAAGEAGGALGAGAGLGGGIGGGVGGGLGGGIAGAIGGGLGVSGGAGGALSLGASASIGGSASAGVTASAGAFAGLRTSTPAPLGAAVLDVQRLQPQSQSTSLAASATADFAVGGMATADASAGLRADVGATASLRAAISFED